jgi:hypothetical protein
VGHGGSRPATAVAHDARICCLYNTEIQPKNVIIIRKKEREEEEEMGVRRRW